MGDEIHMPEYITIRFWCNQCECYRYIALYLLPPNGVWTHEDKCPMCFEQKTMIFKIRNGEQVFTEG